MFRTLQLTLKWPTSLDSLIDFSLWTSKHRSISHNWLFQAIKLLRESGFQFDFPDHTFLELMPNEACSLVSLSSDLAVLETHSWLKSALWCFSQFQIIASLPNPTSYLPKCIESICITLFLSSLVGKFVNTIDTSSYIRLRNKYYWIAGVDFSSSLIFRQVFYTFDNDSGTRVVYFSHWIPTQQNRMQITPCSGCSLYCLDMDEGPLALKTVGGKLIYRAYLSVLPSYRCLQLFQMTVHVDISQQIINLKLSPFILCSYFRFLLGFSDLYIPERYLTLAQPSLMQCDSSPALLPDLTLILSPAFALRPDTKFYLSGTSVLNGSNQIGFEMNLI
ncbi:unnamed protein product [Rhizophagus irregularis]|nr:unnamed protein product [Rhizophagus irregularis]